MSAGAAAMLGSRLWAKMRTQAGGGNAQRHCLFIRAAAFLFEAAILHVRAA